MMRLWMRLKALVSAWRLWFASSSKKERKLAVERDAKLVGLLTPNGG
jgi:hypothetical protein